MIGPVGPSHHEDNIVTPAKLQSKHMGYLYVEKIDDQLACNQTPLPWLVGVALMETCRPKSGASGLI